MTSHEIFVVLCFVQSSFYLQFQVLLYVQYIENPLKRSGSFNTYTVKNCTSKGPPEEASTGAITR